MFQAMGRALSWSSAYSQETFGTGDDSASVASVEDPQEITVNRLDLHNRIRDLESENAELTANKQDFQQQIRKLKSTLEKSEALVDQQQQTLEWANEELKDRAGGIMAPSADCEAEKERYEEELRETYARILELGQDIKKRDEEKAVLEARLESYTVEVANTTRTSLRRDRLLQPKPEAWEEGVNALKLNWKLNVEAKMEALRWCQRKVAECGQESNVKGIKEKLIWRVAQLSAAIAALRKLNDLAT